MPTHPISTGVMLSEAPFPNIAVLFARAGLDFMLIDTEHGSFDANVLSALLMNSRLASLTALVRLPDNHRREITRLMDLGAAGLVLPMTNSPDDIAKVVEHAKYAPVGKRGLSTTRAHSLYDPPPVADYMKVANDRIRIYAQIETAAGLQAAHDIAAVPGVAGLFLGPNDLACDLNCLDDKAPILHAIEQLAQASASAGKTSGIITSDTALITKAHSSGMQLFCAGSELSMLRQAARDTVTRVQRLTSLSLIHI